MDELLLQFPTIAKILAILGSLVVIGQLVVAATPSKNDDSKLAELKRRRGFKQLFSFLESFSPLQKGRKGLESSNKNVE